LKIKTLIHLKQRTENPCVPGSIPGGTTDKESKKLKTVQKRAENSSLPVVNSVAFFEAGKKQPNWVLSL
jgi:hypothetical protein